MPQATALSSKLRCDIHSFFRVLQILPSSRIVRRCSWLVVLLLLPGCNTLNPLCGSARPVPILNAISPQTMVFSQLPPSFVIIATGSHFVTAQQKGRLLNLSRVCPRDFLRFWTVRSDGSLGHTRWGRHLDIFLWICLRVPS